MAQKGIPTAQGAAQICHIYTHTFIAVICCSIVLATVAFHGLRVPPSKIIELNYTKSFIESQAISPFSFPI